MSKLKESMNSAGLKNSDVYLFIFHMFLVGINFAMGMYTLALMWLVLGMLVVMNSSLQGMSNQLINEQDDLLRKVIKQNGELWAIVEKYEAMAKSSTPATGKSKAGKPQTKK